MQLSYLKEMKKEKTKHNIFFKYLFTFSIFIGIGISILSIVPIKSLAACCIPDQVTIAPGGTCPSGFDGCGTNLCCCGTSCVAPNCATITATPSSAPTSSVVDLTTTTGGDTYSWTTTTGGGTFSPTNQRNTSWTVSSAAGTWVATLRTCNTYGCRNCPKSVGVFLAAPTCSSVTGASPIPIGTSTTVTANATNASSYKWNATGGTISTPTMTNTNNWTAPSVAGTYIVSASAINSLSVGVACSTTLSIRACNPNSWNITCPECGSCTRTNDCGTTETINPTCSSGYSCISGSCVADSTCTSGILYVEADGSGSGIRFSKNFTTNGKPLLIITNLPVAITNTVGVVSVAGTFNFPIGKTPDIQAAILSSKDITIEGNQPNDSVIMLQGPLVSKSRIYFNRSVGTQNSKTPAEAVKYDPRFLSETTKLERAHPEYKSYTGLGLVSIQWVYSE